MSPREPPDPGPTPALRLATAARLGAAVAVVVVLVAVAASVAVGSHYDEDDYAAGTASDFTVHTYEGDDAEQRQPGAEDRSYWTESIVYQIPEDEKIYLTESVTYRPMPADCGEGDVDVLGIDRDATYEGERKVDESVYSSVQSYSKDAGARDRYEREAGEYGDLSTADDVYVERIEIQWYGPDEIGTPVELYRGDRFVSAQSECLDNPEAAGWYRWAAFNEGEYENGSEVSQDEPTFAHWYWICDCEDRREAVETLGPPPSEADAETPTPAEEGTETADGQSGDGGAATDEERSNGEGTTADSDEEGRTDDSAGSDPSDAAATSTATASDGTTAPATPTPDWRERRVRTPAAGDGAGFVPGTAVVALLATLAAYGRR